MSNQTVFIKITFKRIQTFLFAVPRLKAMLGANALLGEVLRNDLTKLAEGYGSSNTKLTYTEANIDIYITDPLQQALAATNDALLQDSPELLYNKGILSRDGGHFQAAFPTKPKRDLFVERAIATIEEKLPGLRYEIEPGINAEHITLNPVGHQPVRLPHFQICEDTGTDIATDFQKYSATERGHYVANKVELLEAAGTCFINDNTKDIIGLLEKQLPLHEVKKADDLEKLAGQSGYIALIHADGNGIGQRRKDWAGENELDVEFSFDDKKESRNEFFFHSMRVAVRRAVVDALTNTYNCMEGKNLKYRPYQLLMLGGDDVLLLCRPEHAFAFAVNLAREIKKYKIPYKKKGEEPTKEISMGIGIAISKRNVPFYLLHSLSEQLASNAKHLFRNQPGERSVIDWNMATTSWINDINQHRRNYDIFSNDSQKYCSISRPLFVLPGSDDRHCSLEELLECAVEVQKGFKKDTISRSQFKEAVHLIQDGKADNAEKIYKDHIKKKNEHHKESELMAKLERLFPDGELWEQDDEPTNQHLTRFRDLMELVEINYLGKKTQATGGNVEVVGNG